MATAAAERAKEQMKKEAMLQQTSAHTVSKEDKTVASAVASPPETSESLLRREGERRKDAAETSAKRLEELEREARQIAEEQASRKKAAATAEGAVMTEATGVDTVNDIVRSDNIPGSEVLQDPAASESVSTPVSEYSEVDSEDERLDRDELLRKIHRLEEELALYQSVVEKQEAILMRQIGHLSTLREKSWPAAMQSRDKMPEVETELNSMYLTFEEDIAAVQALIEEGRKLGEADYAERRFYPSSGEDSEVDFDSSRKETSTAILPAMLCRSSTVLITRTTIPSISHRGFFSSGSSDDEKGGGRRQAVFRESPPVKDDDGATSGVEELLEERYGVAPPSSPEEEQSMISGKGRLPSKDSKGQTSEDLPKVVCLPLQRRPLFPGQAAALQITNPETQTAILEMWTSHPGHSYVGVFLRNKPLATAEGDEEDLEDGDTVMLPSPKSSLARSSRSKKAPNGGKRADSEDNEGTEVPKGDKRLVGSRDVVTDPTTELHHVGCYARIQQVFHFRQKDVLHVFLSGRHRILLESTSVCGPPTEVNVTHVLDEEGELAEEAAQLSKALIQETLSVIRQIAAVNQWFKEQIDSMQTSMEFSITPKDLGRLADLGSAMVNADPVELQTVMDTIEPADRLQHALLLLRKELEVASLQQNIQKQMDEKMQSLNREFLLKQQLKVIKKELGLEKDDKEAVLERFREALKGKTVPKDVQTTIDAEMNKLSFLEQNSSEFNITRSYLEWLTSLPWGIYSEDNFNIARASEVLDEDHYGLKDVKERILEFIAVGKLKGSLHGKILCLVGPPGVGKTSVGKSIARSINREFYRFSVGGLSDVAEIKGHRRTYVGAMPGKIIQCLKKAKTQNPLVLIDEIDKLGRASHQGDPASALLEVLDPNQNDSFTDHYMDVSCRVDVLFVCTANQLDTVPGPLQDRMEVIRLSGYDLPEKVQIATQYLIPKAVTANGLSNQKVEFTPKAIEALIKGYCREAGVRNLEKHVDKIMRKLSFMVAKEKEQKSLLEKEATTAEEKVATTVEAREGEGVVSEEEEYGRKDPLLSWDVNKETGCDNLMREVPENVDCIITPKRLVDLVGKPAFTSERLFEGTSPPGVVMGLAWTAMGGTVLYTETVVVCRGCDQSPSMCRGQVPSNDPKGGIEITGQLGEVMSESTKIALTVAKRVVHSIQPDSKFFDTTKIHLHFPEGATPKDGPSAGVTIATALCSLALQRSVKDNLAMTGELSLSGLVLPIGGVKEKAIAAVRAGVTTLCLPLQNKHDAAELPEYLKSNLTIYFVRDFEEVARIALGIGSPAMETEVARPSGIDHAPAR
ncbi:ATP-dependent protease La, putative [Perkinsus marinus ATCC 50983]|uniref:Lon protease homolog n=1 Tax=Perkinsus marinus (strain ATCC 50983 / TXsc) TaxID=423536 RepID=C5KJL7_PERM5|nr:ATP-dependent protease La, putative [Perkinsus marinus ATCC 50983]EER15351.1 ATP-dependent protease La, putative [Perkinsus marinus ATCC 50983]|eukprot:XP_002783555.1 ATP-dependent protease La, putative [Perkinsus marinus ATCC 50983]